MNDKSNEGTGDPSAQSGMDLVSEIHRRLSAVEADNAALKSRLDAAQTSGEVEPYKGYTAHVAHVMQKHFFHDKPAEIPNAD